METDTREPFLQVSYTSQYEPVAATLLGVPVPGEWLPSIRIAPKITDGLEDPKDPWRSGWRIAANNGKTSIVLDIEDTEALLISCAVMRPASCMPGVGHWVSIFLSEKQL